MDTQLQEWHKEFKDFVVSKLIKTFNAKIDHNIRFIDSVESILSDANGIDLNATEALSQLSKTKNKILLNTGQLHDLVYKSLQEDFIEWDDDVNAYLKKLPIRLSERQSDERFRKLPGDSSFIIIGKTFKRLGFSFSKFPERLRNLFRGILGKSKIPLKPWLHEIHVRDLARYYILEGMKSHFHQRVTHYYEALTLSTSGLWLKDETLDKTISHSYTHLNSNSEDKEIVCMDAVNFEELKKRIETDLLKSFEEQWGYFLNSYQKAGTLEFSNRSVSQNRAKKLSSRINKQFEVVNKGWINAVTALKDDWEIDLELYGLIYASLAKYHDKKGEVKVKIESNTAAVIQEVQEYLLNTKSTIESAGSEKKVQSLLIKQHQAIAQELKKLIDKSSEVILNQELPRDVDKLGNSIVKHIEQISTKRVVYKGNDYKKPIKASSLSSISPYELINFEYAPKLITSINEAKQQATFHINEAQNILLQLVDIVSFNLESALSAIDEKDEQKGKAIAINGLERTIEQLDQIKNELNKILLHLDEKLLSSIEAFNSNIIKFTDNENILELRVRIMRAKATERSKAIRKKLVQNIRDLIPILIRKGRMYFNRTKDVVQGNLKKLGIGSEEVDITTELADFLAQTEEAVDRLPFVYQRLFRALPLEDDTFFESRLNEIKQLLEAYKQWNKKRFAATLIIGEKGSGISSLINVFVQKPEVKYKKVRVAVQHNIHSTEELLSLFTEALNSEAKSLAELATELQKGKKIILVLENIQRLFLKHVGGFDNIKSITELISITSEKVLWLVGCTEFGYDYLNKTIRLSENFGYVVGLEKLSPEAIIELVERRHSVSGYKLLFEPRPEDLRNKKFVALDESEQQGVLKNEYFNELIKIAQSNISIALIYWLRSTKHTSENTITIGSLKNMDFSFMKSLSMDKLYVLHMLLLHDGLTESEVTRVNRLNISQCRRLLYPLFEDGIIIRSNQVYSVNPLLYRQSINLLKTKNILH